MALNDDRDVQALLTLKSSIEAFAHNHNVETFVIKTRLGKGKLAAGGITFKIEALFQLSMTPVKFISPQTLAKFAKTNLGGVPEGVFEYQKDAYRVILADLLPQNSHVVRLNPSEGAPTGHIPSEYVWGSPLK